MRFPCLLAVGLSVSACSGYVERSGDGSTLNRSPDPSRANAAGSCSSAGGSTDDDTTAPVSSISCRYLHGSATLTDYRGANYPTSAFSFEFATQDPNITYNEFDVMYEADLFQVNLVGGDESFIVDLGDVALRDVPATVDPNDYALGGWGEHDDVQAQIHHTYFVRSIDGAGRLVAAFRVVGLQPGVRVTIEWIRSTDPDQMVVPEHCGV
jgi:hypothetical protein